MNSCRVWYCLCVILPLCVLLFSRFFCWALGVTLFSPYGSCSPTLDSRNQWRDSQLESQLSNMEFLADCIILWISSLNINDIPAGLFISIKYSSVQPSQQKLSNQQDNRLCARTIAHFESKVWFTYTVWVCYEYNLKLAIFRKQDRMCYELSV